MTLVGRGFGAWGGSLTRCEYIALDIGLYVVVIRGYGLYCSTEVGGLYI